MMGKFRKKPVVIEAIKVTENTKIKDILAFADGSETPISISMNEVVITTLEGAMTARVGDWIIKGLFDGGKNELYPCKPDIFVETYEPVEEDE